MTKVDDLIAWATRELGKPYTYGAEGPNTFDCSGLMQYVYSQVGIKLPRTAAEQQKATTRVSAPVPGDLVFFGDPAYHVGLYIGGGKMITAPHTGAVVHVVAVGNPTTYGRVAGLGAALAPVVSTVSTLVTPVGNSVVDAVVGGARGIFFEVLFAGLGVALVGYGVYKAASPRIRSATNDIIGV